MKQSLKCTVQLGHVRKKERGLKVHATNLIVHSRKCNASTHKLILGRVECLVMRKYIRFRTFKDVHQPASVAGELE